MPDVLVRNVDAAVVEKIKLRAKRQHRSFQAELKTIINRAAALPEPLSSRELFRKFRNSLSQTNVSDSVDLLREDRSR